MRSTIMLGLVLLAASCGKSDGGGGGGSGGSAAPTKRKWKTDGYRDTEPAARAAAQRALAAANLGLSSEWMADPVRDGERQFTRYDVVLELYLAEAEELVAVANEPALTLDNLIARTKPGVHPDGWPFWSYRFKSITDQGSAGNDFWVRGPLQKNVSCGDSGCPDVWHDSDGDVGFVMFRVLDQQRFRCAARGIDLGKGNSSLDQAFTACKSMTLAAK